jgi:DNA polymerase III subunit epsilon
MNIIFLDFEASSLSERSWPIEIGFAWLDHKQKIRSEARLIRPHESWPLDDWSERSAEVHKIPFQDLEAADPAVEVARWAASLAGFARLVVDAPAHDGMWLNRLMQTINRADDFEVASWHEEIWATFEGPALSMAHRARANGKSAHRADQDAASLAQAWRAAMRKS